MRESAVWDQGRWDLCYWDVMLSPGFSKVLKRFRSIATPIPHIPLDGDITMPLDGTRECCLDVYTLHWKRLKKRFKKAT